MAARPPEDLKRTGLLLPPVERENLNRQLAEQNAQPRLIVSAGALRSKPKNGGTGGDGCVRRR
jgi:hypothetical protein